MRILSVALIACVLVFAATVPAAGLVIEAKDARIKTAGAALEGGWNLHSNGEVGDYVRAEAGGGYEMIVRARGTPCKGEWPVMQALVDGGAGGPTVSVNSKDFADYSLRVEIPAGVHLLTVAFTNDALEGGEDRNLYLERIEVRPTPGGQDVALSATEYANCILEFTGALTGDINVIVPASPCRQWTVYNDTTGAHTLTVKPASGTGVAVSQGKRSVLYADGSNIVRVTADV